MARDKTDVAQISGKQKAAIFLACMGSERASRIMSSMSEAEVEEMTLALSSLEGIDPNTRSTVINEFYEMAIANKVMTSGGIDYARKLLEKAFGSDRTIEILTRLQSNLQDVPFQFLKKADPSQIVTFIQDEHPQTISLILAHLSPAISSIILSGLPIETQMEVVTRIATMERTPPEVVREVERVLERKMAAIFTQGFTFAGGVKEVAEILNTVDRATEKAIMGKLQETDPELASDILRLMFTFEDVARVDDAGIQKTLREIESKDLALALKGSNEEVAAKIYKNMSERSREMIKEEISYMGPVRLKHVEEAQQKIVAVVRRLEEAGELVVEGRGGGSENEIVV